MSKKGSKFALAVMGRPTTYKPEYCQRLIEWFTGARTVQVLKRRVVIPRKNGKGEPQIAEEFVERPGKFPTFEGFAHFVCDANVASLRDWALRHPDFSSACARARQLQKDWLCEVTTMGLGNPHWAVFLAKNLTDLREEPPAAPPTGRIPIRVNPFGARVLTNGTAPAENGNGHSNGHSNGNGASPGH